MSIGETINRLFSGVNPNPPAAQPAAAPVHPQGTTIPANAGQGAPATAGTAPNGTIPVDTSSPATAPLDPYKELWQNKPTDPNAPPADTSFLGPVNGDDLLKAASNIDFTKIITPEMATAIAAGGEEGTKATLQAMNAVAQLTHAQSANATTKIVELALEKATQRFQDQIPQLLRNQNTDSLIKENPVLSHPGASPLISGLVNQLQTKYPEATPAELKKHAEDYLTNFSKSFLNTTGVSTTTSQSNTLGSPQPDNFDWEQFFKH